ncbi:maternal effect protein oskar [Anopheles maculipalpis]|uniref:maternal effect protein oskar n=1 Tax=Anopheles maculipalpis TaxID=1496333 RepID=UPI0021593A52|nr:maternal effect protein oskar [Anopheles maculipalpis]XP_050070136.1 maternal effect protein oskar [Anopheles maculipalpis]
MVLLAPSISNYDREEELKIQLRSVIITRSKEGATIDEIIDDYRELTGTDLLSFFYNRIVLARYLSMLDNVWCSTDGSGGFLLWFCSTPRTKHMVHMIQQQRSPRAGRSSYKRYMPRVSVAASDHQSSRLTGGVETGSKMATQTAYNETAQMQEPARSGQSSRFQRRTSRVERYVPYSRRTAGRTGGTGWRQSRSDELDYSMYGPSYHRHQLVGDDFFLAIAKWELGFAFDQGHSIDMSGLCISGLTLSEAAKRVEIAPYIADHVIVNVGTVDLLHGREMIDLIHDFDQLVARFRERSVEPIMTTLAPIANSGGRTPMADRLLKMNEYICRNCPRTIDLWKHFVHANGTTRFECYQPGPRKVSGSIMPHVLWNKLGRQMMLGVLGNEIAAQLTTDEHWRYY